MLSVTCHAVGIRNPQRSASRVIWTLRVLVVLLCLTLYPLQPGTAAPLAQDVALVITSPREGMTVSGQVAYPGDSYPAQLRLLRRALRSRGNRHR
jgi:hypothetical protein